ncbi:hypothetical protein M011DRAFT_468331 [Sporormia fimetaria CBS 119925]|uniref:DUF1772-domain-containing protein n=1 Tax=Sporormia fimetaria CBS 119925 TaxID=1340428 RepID=A0A6A6VAA5_9PLEO|nr:hypothetical protein M011DRAFT_468331 [Sporormia fimetaria CBS 119925]
MAIGLANEQTPTGIRVAQVVGITASAFLFGQNASLSYIATPTVMKAPAGLAAQQWAHAYGIGKKLGPPLAIISSLSTAYVAYHQDIDSLPFKLNVAATVLVPAIVPFTYAFMIKTNNKLLEKSHTLSATADDKAETQEENVHALLDKWATLNLARAMLVGVGSILAAWGAVSKLEIVSFGNLALGTGADRLG